MKYAAVAFALFAGAVQAYTGNDLLREIEGKTHENIMATQYIRGVVDGAQVAATAAGQQQICLPADVALGQIVEVVHQDLQRVPAVRNHEARYVVYGSMAKAYPCKPGGAK